jgi:hypothetical protein
MPKRSGFFELPLGRVIMVKSLRPWLCFRFIMAGRYGGVENQGRHHSEKEWSGRFLLPH